MDIYIQINKYTSAGILPGRAGRGHIAGALYGDQPVLRRRADPGARCAAVWPVQEIVKKTSFTLGLSQAPKNCGSRYQENCDETSPPSARPPWS